ncbi:hypothetical protein A946_09115 [Methylacidiphilum kamchatkense Kam1]|uniref:AAA15 family ATPase/GTPase n=1 Tax=Methylacidiphilum kamchatkense Kam1 TaxID=1202785 RepID=A0A0C1RJ08_9BACT|nr:ATP-binding protein [Methylacidiphilum kamchatkense]KIE58062.1 hypothetical protein A946_09115 [Methylacidiphilum kamchatkense Kam1]QDQ41626.1 AAA15 family ATPase/GTPase [Methylacidiphilum kamchatkense Kam1]
MRIHSLEITNFRCFKDLALDDLSRINIITGDNAAGKTTILEAIYIACKPNPRAIEWLTPQRIPPSFLQKDYFASSVKRYFNDPSSNIVFLVNKKNSAYWRVELKFYPSPDSSILPYAAAFQEHAISTPNTPENLKVRKVYNPDHVFPRLELHIQEDNKTEEINWMGFTDTDMIQEGVKEIVPYTFFFGSSVTYDPSESAKILSSLKEKKEESVFLDAFKKEYPEIKDIFPLIPPDFPRGAVFFEIEGQDLIIPSTLYSSGTHKSLTIFLIASDSRFSQGIILVDEIENGIHWSRMKSFWRLLNKFTTQRQIQVFATTHSYECLESFVDVMKESAKETEFTIIHAKKDAKTNRFSASVIPGEFAESAIRSRLEIR